MMMMQDPGEKQGHNGGHKYRLPGLVSSGDSGIEDDSESEYEDVLSDDGEDIGDDHFKGTQFFEEYFDAIGNRPGSSMVEEHERSCPKLESGEKCKVHKSANDVKLCHICVPQSHPQTNVSILNILNGTMNTDSARIQSIVMV